MSDAKSRLVALAGASAATALLLLIPSAGVEGNRAKPYRDVGGVWTVCAGVTGSRVNPRHLYSPEECRQINSLTIAEHAERALPCVRVPMSDSRKVGLVVFSYNVGPGAFCGSSLAHRLNVRDPRACEEITEHWYKAGGRDCRIRSNNCYGLIDRRKIERALCEGYPLDKVQDLIDRRM
jgi:lysozyme